MFFPDRIISIKPNDKVLEVGPGSNPYHRSDILLELRFSTEEEAYKQRGHTSPINTEKKIVYYDGGAFPFNENEFDYVICSHVLEHVEDVPFFISELQRIAPKGYLEFPTIYYDFIYDFPEHVTFLLYLEDTNKLNYMLKNESDLHKFSSVTKFFYASAQAGYTSLINELKPFLFQGFEWADKITTTHVRQLEEITYNNSSLIIPKASETLNRKKTLASKTRKIIRNIFSKY